jgi:hypothetical protein
MSLRPATIHEDVAVNLPEPRKWDSRVDLASRDCIFNALGMSPLGRSAAF